MEILGKRNSNSQRRLFRTVLLASLCFLSIIVQAKNNTTDSYFGIPSFVSSTPINGTTGISRSADIVLTFSEAMSVGTANATNIRVIGSQTGIIAASFSGGGTTEITINPTADFKPGELITVTLLTGLQSTATNEALSDAYSIQFTVTTSAIDYFSLPITPVKTTIASGTSADGLKSIYIVDLDGDGDMDILGASDPGDKLMLYENDGSQNFTTTTLESGAGVNALHSVFATDIDNDGDMDIVASGKSSSTKINYYLNDGTATLSDNFTKFDYKNEVIGASSKTVYVSDMDNDGDKDIVYLSNSGSGYIAIAENDGSLSFSAIVVDNSMATPWGMYVEDIDSDGDLDIIVGTATAGTNTDKISWYENDGTASFTERSISTTADSVRSVFVIDVDGDGDMDLLSTSVDNNTVSWYQNNGSEVFTKIDIDTGANGAQEVTATDVDGDGDIDVLSANQTDNTIALYLNDGSEVFTKKIITDTNTNARFVRFADLDSDGDLDILSTATSDDLSWYENKLTNSWSGTTDTDWDTTTNWSLGAIPTGTTDVLITDVTNDPVASGAISVKETILNTNASLTVNGAVTNNDAIIVNSGASLIAKTSVSGNITYKRNLATTNWYLISSPVVGESVVDFVTNNSTALGSGAGVSQNVALAPYDNTQADANDRWSYYTVGLTDGINGDDTTDNLTSGQGFTTKLSTAGDISFTGTMPVTNVAIEITDGTANEFNLVGNPYPSYVALNDLADGTNNLFRANGTNGGAGNDGNVILSEDTVWFWDQSLNLGAGAYTQVNLISSRFIPPGQAFFVKRTTDVGTLNFNFRENMQSHQSTDVFSRVTDNRPKITVSITDGNNVSTSDIFYINQTTTGWDNGYDSTTFRGTTNDFAVYTHLVSDSQGQNLAIQSLPDSNYENNIIPLGVTAASGLEIVFTADVANFPTGTNIYLEDKEVNTFTRLEGNANYTVTLNTALSGIGRFFIHTTESALSVEGSVLENVSVYTTNNRNLRITGIQNGNTLVKLYNILGQQILEATFEANGLNDISLPSSLRKGVYIVQVKNDKAATTKKIAID